VHTYIGGVWEIAGHQILLGGGPYRFDHGDPLVIVHCRDCPAGDELGWVLWQCEEEDGEPVPSAAGLRAVVEHLREQGVTVPDDLLDSALLVSGLANDVGDGLTILESSLRSHTDH
jgi:hypothetical protein